MRYFYFSRNEVFSPLAAAILHVGLFIKEGFASRCAMNFLIDKALEINCPGKMLFLGHDEKKNEVFVLNAGREVELTMNLLASFLTSHGIASQNYRLCDLSGCSNPWLQMASFFGRYVWSKPLAAFFCRRGLARAWMRLI